MVYQARPVQEKLPVQEKIHLKGIYRLFFLLKFKYNTWDYANEASRRTKWRCGGESDSFNFHGKS